MSEQLYTQEQIVHHVENASPTKFMYSFGRAARFPPIKRFGFSDSFYEIPSTKMKRTAGFGFGTKSDFTRGQHYELTTVNRDYDKGKTRGPSFSFGLSRDAYKKAFCPGYKNEDKNIPGAAKYNILKSFGYDSPKYTFRRKDICIVGQTQSSKTPGPGAYKPVININDKGKCPLSKYSNVKVNDFGADHVQRFNYCSNKFPAPNAYGIKSLMGSNYNSKYRSGKLITMAPKYDAVNTHDNYPGPGSYLRFSEFGILVPKNYRGSHCETTIEANADNSKKRITELEVEKNNNDKDRAKTLEP